jgi:FlaG/FlaF family flagellin (archaellin)
MGDQKAMSILKAISVVIGVILLVALGLFILGYL